MVKNSKEKILYHQKKKQAETTQILLLVGLINFMILKEIEYLSLKMLNKNLKN